MKCPKCRGLNAFLMDAITVGCPDCGYVFNNGPRPAPSVMTVTFENGKSYMVNTLDKRLIDADNVEEWIPFRDAPYCEKCQKAMSFYYKVSSKIDHYDCKCGEVRQVSRSFREKPKLEKDASVNDLYSKFAKYDPDDVPF